MTNAPKWIKYTAFSSAETEFSKKKNPFAFSCEKKQHKKNRKINTKLVKPYEMAYFLICKNFWHVNMVYEMHAACMLQISRHNNLIARTMLFGCIVHCCFV